ncbi:unnamed protein product [Arctia plantaginis]|uniref:Uncharacterized protein n=1 Tax=Arctia plantaginis TaxID=874455 RepID=A0A8S0Z6J5_ARCPL|nr:unnamed protein product [Arctia plantaginis]CAB3228400.1 unnamed protein product [Arctia plantaginis]
MERLSHDLNLALEESNCGRQERRKLGLRRRTRSAGNLPAVTVSLVEDGSSSSPPQAPLITQPLSDSDDPHLNLHNSSLKSRHYCQIGNFESDSFNENFSPTRPANARRKRKYKKMPVEYADGKRSPPIEILSVTTEPNALPATIILQGQVLAPMMHGNRHKTHSKTDSCFFRNAFCGKRKWSHRDKGDGCEMRERSFSGGCSSKSAYFSKNDFKSRKYDTNLPKKEPILQPGKIVLKSQNTESAQPATITTPSLPGSSSFNFVYKNMSKNGTPTLSKMTGYKIATDLPPFFSPSTSSGKYYRKFKMLNKTYPQNSLRNPLQFEDSNSGMDCAGNESSSLSSSDSDGVVTNDSDREGDDELTDWPGIEELKVFNKSLTIKTTKSVNNNSPKSTSSMPPPKRLKKEKMLVKSGWTSSKNRFKKKRPKVDSGNDEDAMMSDSKTVVDLEEELVSKENRDILQPHSSFSSFSDIKNAGVSGQNANQSFFQSFQAFQEKSGQKDESFNQTPRTNFSLQKTSSSDLNLSEKSPQSDHYYSEHSMGNAAVTEVREIRAGCRRIRDERPGFLILSAANEQLSKFLQDSCQTELKLPSFHDPEEKEKLESLAKLYSLELQVEMGRPVLRKTSNTMQAIRVEHSYHNFPSDHKRRCYGDDTDTSLSLSDQNSVNSINDLEVSQDVPERQCDMTPQDLVENFSQTLVDKSLLDPGEID